MNHLFAENPGNAENTFILPFVFTDKVKEAVESIWKCHNPAEHRLFLIDNSSDPFEDRAWLEEHCHLYIRAYRNLGPAVAYNLGISLARTQYVTIFSDDARLIHKMWYPGSLKIIANSQEDTVVSMGNIFPQWTDGDFYQRDKVYSEEEYIALAMKYQNQSSQDFNFATAIAKKSVFEKIGLFPEDTYINGVDAEFIREAERHNIKTVQSGDIVFHYGDQSHKGRLVEHGKHQQTGILDNRMVVL